MNKNETIRKTLAETRARHKGMDCFVYEVKVRRSKLSYAQKSQINQYFREGKWFYNDVVSDLDHADAKKKSVSVKIGEDEFEERDLEILGSQVKQSIITSVKDSIKGLHVRKEHGYKVGMLKYKYVLNAIPLKQILKDAEMANAVFFQKSKWSVFSFSKRNYECSYCGYNYRVVHTILFCFSFL